MGSVTDTGPTAARTGSGCPVHGAGHRKIRPPGERDEPAVEWRGAGRNRLLVIRSHPLARQLLRLGTGTRQGGFLGDLMLDGGLSIRHPVLYLEGAEHREHRSSTARFFAPRVVERNYQEMIDAEVEQALTTVRSQPVTRLDIISLRLAVAVVAKVIGLTHSDRHRLGKRLASFFRQRIDVDVESPRLPVILQTVRNHRRLLSLYLFDVRPAARARRREPGEDLISHLIATGHRDSDLLVECLTFAAAGMVTTREFISMAAWHLLEKPDLRATYLSADRKARIAILEEILRLEPVVGHIKRRVTADLVLDHDGEPLQIPAGTLVNIQVRSTNVEPAVFGPDGLCLRPGRDLGPGVSRSGLAFGDGAHTCPGEFLALQESDSLLVRLLAMDLRLERTPTVGHSDVIAGYDLRHLVVSLTSADPWRHGAGPA